MFDPFVNSFCSHSLEFLSGEPRSFVFLHQPRSLTSTSNQRIFSRGLQIAAVSALTFNSRQLYFIDHFSPSFVNSFRSHFLDFSSGEGFSVFRQARSSAFTNICIRGQTCPRKNSDKHFLQEPSKLQAFQHPNLGFTLKNNGRRLDLSA